MNKYIYSRNHRLYPVQLFDRVTMSEVKQMKEEMYKVLGIPRKYIEGDCIMSEMKLNSCVDSVCSCSNASLSSCLSSLCNGHTISSVMKPKSVYINKELLKKYKLPGDIRFIDDDGKVEELYIKRVVYSNPATVVFWSDDSKTVCKCHGGDKYNPETGLVLCMLKKMCGNTHIKNTIDAWLPEAEFRKGKVVTQTSKEARKHYKK